METASTISVVGRFRPITAQEAASGSRHSIDNLDTTSVTIRTSEGVRHAFTLDKMWGTNASQQEVYGYVRPVVLAVCQGYNGCLIAYGQTGSGKTHTMLGSQESQSSLGEAATGGKGGPAPVDEGAGIIPRAIHDIFSHLSSAGPEMSYEISVTMVEVYQERIRDLLDPRQGKDNLAIGEYGGGGGCYVKDALVLPVSTEEEVLEAVRIGASNRVVGATGMNAQSSRSHSLFSMTLTAANRETGVTSKATLYLVDLAGSETVSKTGVQGLGLEELKRINKSLLALGQVITALTDGKAQHVPYRDSKLTRLLQQGLGGNARTVLLITCSPSALNESETLSTLRFGRSAKRIKQRAVANVEVGPEEVKRRLAVAEARLTECTRREKEWLRAYREGLLGSGPSPAWLQALAAAAEKDQAAPVGQGAAAGQQPAPGTTAGALQGASKAVTASSVSGEWLPGKGAAAAGATVGGKGGDGDKDEEEDSSEEEEEEDDSDSDSETGGTAPDAGATPDALRAALLKVHTALKASKRERAGMVEERGKILGLLAAAQGQLKALRQAKESAEASAATAAQEVADAHAALLKLSTVGGSGGGTSGLCILETVHERVRENQRLLPGMEWSGANLLPSDPPEWASARGAPAPTGIDAFPLPPTPVPGEAWVWMSDWTATAAGQSSPSASVTDPEAAWTYGTSFDAPAGSEGQGQGEAEDTVRHRTWTRQRALVRLGDEAAGGKALLDRLAWLESFAHEQAWAAEEARHELAVSEQRFMDLAEAVAGASGQPDAGSITAALAHAARSAAMTAGSGDGSPDRLPSSPARGGGGGGFAGAPASSPSAKGGNEVEGLPAPGSAAKSTGTGFFRSMLKKLALSPGGGKGAGKEGSAGVGGGGSSKALTGGATIVGTSAAGGGKLMARLGQAEEGAGAVAAAPGPSPGPSYETLKPFFTACETGDLPAVKAALSSGQATLDSLDKSGRPPILYAARGGQLPIMQELVRLGCSVGAFDKDARTSLMYAARRGHVEVAAWLLLQGASPNQCDVHGLTALHQATLGRSTAMAELLLKAGADLSIRDCNGNTPYKLSLKFQADWPEGKVLTACLHKWISKLPQDQHAAAGLEAPE